MIEKASPSWIDQLIPVRATFVVSRFCVQSFVKSCPYCGGCHWHSGSSLDSGDPRETFSDGSRASHCHNGEYRLVPSGEPALFEMGHSRDPRARAGMERLRRLGIPTSNATLKLPRSARR
jgi:hypothetical protein